MGQVELGDSSTPVKSAILRFCKLQVEKLDWSMCQ